MIDTNNVINAFGTFKFGISTSMNFNANVVAFEITCPIELLHFPQITEWGTCIPPNKEEGKCQHLMKVILDFAYKMCFKFARYDVIFRL